MTIERTPDMGRILELNVRLITVLPKHKATDPASVFFTFVKESPRR